MLDKLPKIKGNTKKAKRLGRGYSSNKGGHTVGFGTKGQKSRGRGKMPFGFEGGQVPLYKRLPQMGGFRNPTSKSVKGISLSKLNIFKDGEEVSPIVLLQRKVLKKLPKDGVKLLATGELKRKLELKDFLYSAKAREIIGKSGSKIHE